MPGKRVLTDGQKPNQKRGKKGKLKTANNKIGEMDVETKSDGVTEKLSVSKVLDLEADGATEYLCPIEKEGDTVLEVECGPNKALMYLSKLYQGSKGSCLSFQGSWLTPNEFQYVSGRETAKDWKRSIRHQGKSIKLLFAKGILSVGGGGSSKNGKRPKKGGKRSSSSRRGRRKVNVNLDSAGEENGECRETEVQCGKESMEGDSEGGKSNSEPSKDQINSEGELSDANSDSTENYDVDFMDSVSEQEKVPSQSEDKSKLDLTVNRKSTSGRYQNAIDVFSFESNEESNSSLDKTCDKKSVESEIVTEKNSSPECEANTNNDDGVDDVEEKNPECEKEPLKECKSDEGDDHAEELEATEQPTEEEEEERHNEAEEDTEQEDSEEKKEDTVVPVVEEEEVTQDREAEEEQREEDKMEEEEVEEEQKVEEQKVSAKRPSPARESKLGSIIDQLRVNREKVTKERREHAADLTTKRKDCPNDLSSKTGDCPTVETSSKKQDYPADLTKDNRHDQYGFTKDQRKEIDPLDKIRLESMSDMLKLKPEEVTDATKEKREFVPDAAKLDKAMWQMPTQPIRNPLATEMKIAKIIDEQRKDSRKHAPSAEERKVPKSHSLTANLHQKKHPERSPSAPSEIMEFLHKKRGSTPNSDRHSFPSAGMLYPWMKKESEDGGERLSKSQTSSPSARLTPIDKVKKSSSSSREKKESSSDKDYNDYMRALAAKQERNPFFLSPPVHDPYLSMWTPDLLFPPGLFNPYSMFLGPNGQRGEVPTTSSMSSLCSMPPSGGLPGFLPRPPHSMSYPILDSYVPHSSPKESPSLPHSCPTNSRKRGPAEADTACALDLSTKRTKLECSKNDFFTSPLSRSSESVDNCKKNALLNLSNVKTEGDKSNFHKSHHNSHRHKKSNHSTWPEKDIKGQKLQCKCGADNPENIMNWSAEKVFDFVSKLEGCSSYAKTFLAHRIEGKLLPLLTTDALIRNLGMKVGPAIILSEAVTRHVQDMSRFFHPCSYCKLKSSQRLSV